MLAVTLALEGISVLLIINLTNWDEQVILVSNKALRRLESFWGVVGNVAISPRTYMSFYFDAKQLSVNE